MREKKCKNTNQAPSRPPAIRPPTSASTDNINGIPRQEWEIMKVSFSNFIQGGDRQVNLDKVRCILKDVNVDSHNLCFPYLDF